MNKIARFILIALKELGAVMFVGDDLETDILADIGEKAKIVSYTPSPEPDPAPAPPDDDDDDDDEGKGKGKGDPAPAEGDPPPAPTEEEKELARINKAFKTEFTSIDELLKSEIPARVEKLPELLRESQEKEKQLKELMARVDELENEIDPLAHFASPEEYVRQQLLKKYPEFDPSVLSKVVRSKDLDKEDPVKILTLQRLMKDGDIYRNEKEVIESIQDDFEYDPDISLDEQETKVRNKILRAAKEARNEFKALQQEVTLPSKEAVVAERKKQREELAAKWEPVIAEDFASRLKKVEFKTKDGQTEFEFEVEDKYVQSVLAAQKAIAADLAKRGQQPSPELREAVVEEYLNYYKSRNLTKIAKAYANKLVKDMDQAMFDAIHNPRPKRRDDSPAPGEKDSRAKSKARAEAEIEKDLP